MTDQSAVPAQPSYNILSIIGFVISLLGFNVVAIILGAIGLSQIKKSGERGRGFALAAIWIGVISLILGIIAIIAFIAFTAAASSGA